MNGDHNSLVPTFEVGLVTTLLMDVAAHYPGLSRELSRDAEVISRRVAHEGLPFLTTTLSQLGKAIDRSFQTGQLHAPTSFQRRQGTALPLLFRGLTSRVYESGGALKSDADVDCVAYLRQLTLIFAKYEVPYKAHLVEAKIANWKQTESEAFEHRDGVHSDDYTQIVLLAQDLLFETLRDLDPLNIRPRHGPGAVATGETGDQKWIFKRLYSAIHAVFRYPEYFFVNFRDFCDRILLFQKLELVADGESKLILVPKDYRGPRVIDEQPLEYQYIQQGLRVLLYEHLEAHCLTAGHVNFTRQDINQGLALSGSLTGEWSTLDFKDASDRNTVSLVRLLWAKLPRWIAALFASRTNRTVLPGGDVLPLKKFAPMGSAVCFPVMALNIWALTVAAMQQRLGWSRRRCLKNVYIYGDDLIVPAGVEGVVLRYLPMFGFRVNVEKSYTAGPFRESCGTDAFRGETVTPIRVRTLWNHEKRLLGQDLISWIAVTNGLYAAGYWRASAYLRDCITRSARLKIPSSASTSSSTASWKFYTQGVSGSAKLRWNKRLQRLERLAPKVTPASKPSTLDGWAAVQRSLLQGSQDRVVDSRATKTTAGWQYDW